MLILYLVRNYRGRENFGRGRGGFTSGYRQSEFARTRTYRDEDDNKPVMKLFDPTLVPKSSKYFEVSFLYFFFIY